VAFGHNRERYNDTSELQKYAGIAFEPSGKKIDTFTIELSYFFKKTCVE
jgi:hypothetical protein